VVRESAISMSAEKNFEVDWEAFCMVGWVLFWFLYVDVASVWRALVCCLPCA